MPKSMTFTTPSKDTMMVLGSTSRWMTAIGTPCWSRNEWA